MQNLASCPWFLRGSKEIPGRTPNSAIRNLNSALKTVIFAASQNFYRIVKRIYFLILFLLPMALHAQLQLPPHPVSGETLPAWAQEMYSENPNVWRVDDGYRIWRRSHPDDKTTFTQFYKKWRRYGAPYINTQGFIQKPTDAEVAAFQSRLKSFAVDRSQGWTNIGPFETFNVNSGPDPLAKSEQANIYCIEQSLSDPNVVYCGTEGGEIFKTTDKGLNWFCVSRAYATGAPSAIEVNPGNPDTVYVAENDHILKSVNGGATWNVVLNVTGLGANQIAVNPADPQIVLAATFRGLYRSTDGGAQWQQLFPEACYDIEWKTDDPATAFLVRNDPAANICRFYKSGDSGATWELKSNGWFFSDQPGVYDGGAQIAVSKADPKRVYAVLIGEAKTDDNGFIGIYRSDDAGETWTLPNPPAGGPWSAGSHPDMATIGAEGGYHQGFYNLGFDVSDTDPDMVMAGFLNLWISHDGAASFDCIGGYCSNDFNYVHPDCQEIEINGGDIWMVSDGGVEFSGDSFQTHYARNRGITSSDFWGFGSGWNEDVLVGGRYHNGNTGWFEDWLPGECLGLGGGEAATGYVNPGEEREAYFSDIGGVILPEMQNGFAQYSPGPLTPNESYYDAESGEMEWDPRCWNHFYVTRDNNLWKTTDGGSTWEVVHEFGTDEAARVMGFEICRSNPKVIYLYQRNADTWLQGTLWKTTDGGANWSTLPLPPGYARRLVLAVNAEDENTVYIAYVDGDNGQKIYGSNDGGQTWNNLSTPALDGEHITYLLYQGGMSGALYAGSFRTVWYWEPGASDWMPLTEGLPAAIATDILRPFYRDDKLRMGAYGKGIWERPFVKPTVPVAQPMASKLETDCPGDVIHFDDYSMLSHAGASWHWEFPGGTPSTSDLRNPAVVYSVPGTYDVILTVSNPQGSSTKKETAMITVKESVVNHLPVKCDFSNGLSNLTIVNPDGDVTWEPIVLNTCEPGGDTAYWVHNYVYSGYGIDDILFPTSLDLTTAKHPTLKFRVAYAPYFDGNAFIDSLKVLISADCGNSYTTLFRSGGEALSTTTSGIGNNNLYEYDEFTPQNCDEWREIELDLSAYEGKYVTLKIVNQSGYGNNMYVDDISLVAESSTSTQTPHSEILMKLQPNPARNTAWLRGKLPAAAQLELSLSNALGDLLRRESVEVPAGNWERPLDLSTLPSGVYWLRVESGGESRVFRLVKGE